MKRSEHQRADNHIREIPGVPFGHGHIPRVERIHIDRAMLAVTDQLYFERTAVLEGIKAAQDPRLVGILTLLDKELDRKRFLLG